MHPVIAQGIVTQQVRDLHTAAAAERRARQAGRSRRPGLAVRLTRAGRAPRPVAAPGPARGPAAA